MSRHLYSELLSFVSTFFFIFVSLTERKDYGAFARPYADISIINAQRVLKQFIAYIYSLAGLSRGGRYMVHRNF